MKLILEAIKRQLRRVEQAVATVEKRCDGALLTADTANESAAFALSVADNAQTTADNAQTAADNAQTTATNAQENMHLPYHRVWERSSGAGYTQTVTIDGRTFTRKMYVASAYFVDGLHGGVYGFKKTISDTSWIESTEYIREKNYWVGEDSSGRPFGVVYNEDGEPIIIATKSANTEVKGTVVKTAGVYVYGEEDYSVNSIKCYSSWGTSESLLYKFQKLCGDHSIEGNPPIVKSSTEGSTKKFKITVDDSGTITAVEVT